MNPLMVKRVMKDSENAKKKKELQDVLKRIGVLPDDAVGCITIHVNNGSVAKVIPALEALRS
jgi:hypothetical protein